MKRTAFIISAAALLAVLSACSARHGIGYVNNELSYRIALEGMKAEVSIGGSVANAFSDDITDLPGLYYRESERGSTGVQIPLGLAYYYTVFKNGIFDISAGIKYRNYFRVDYAYTYQYEAYTGSRGYRYEETLEFSYFNSNRVSLIFPDAEIKCPFSDNLKFTLGIELVYARWNFNGGTRAYSFWQNVSTGGGYTEGGSDVTTAPGAANNLAVGSDIFSLGGIHAGILYYF